MGLPSLVGASALDSGKAVRSLKRPIKVSRDRDNLLLAGVSGAPIRALEAAISALAS
jgi:hypothetical protein